MTKQKIIKQVQEDLGCSDEQASLAVDAVLEAMQEGLAKHGQLKLRYFGAFSLTVRDPWMGRNPATGESVRVVDAKWVRFKPAEEFKRRLQS